MVAESCQEIVARQERQREHCEQKLRAWLHVVARIKTLPKELVCSEECEQHALYGRMFQAHPLNAKEGKSEEDEEEDEDEDEEEEDEER